MRPNSILVLMVLLSSVAGSSLETCGTEESTSLKLSLSSRRNQTNHRIVTIDVDKESPLIRNTSGKSLMELDVFHKRTVCNAKERVQLATVAAVSEEELKLRRSDYELFPGVGYYKLHTTAETWNNAYTTCANENAHLIVINSNAESNVVKNLFARNVAINGTQNKDYLYIGIHDRVTEGKYEAVTGELLTNTGYLRWASGQPDGGSNQNALVVDKDALLRDHDHSYKFGFVCEQEI